MTDQTGAKHAFIEWAKHRLDEMDAGLAAMEEHMAALKDKARKEAAEGLSQARKWRDGFAARVKEVETKGEGRRQELGKYFDDAWANFEKEMENWAAASEHATEGLNARAKALFAGWSATAQRYRTQAAAAADARHKQMNEAVTRLERDVAHYRANFEKLQGASTVAWAAMGAALRESSQAFETAAKTARAEFDTALKDRGGDGGDLDP